MLEKILRTVPLLLVATSGWADFLPGFGLEQLSSPKGFPSSIAFDADGVLHYTTTDGGIFRHEDGEDLEVARVDSANEGNAAFLGMAFAPDGTAVVHYVSADMTADVVSRIELSSGEETILARLDCNPGGIIACNTEHHGGNPDVTSDGTIFFGIGDQGRLHFAQLDDSPAGKMYRIDPDGTVEVWAKGFRNPFDLAWDERYGRIIAEDNGASGNSDEIVFVQPGENHGWPLTMGNEPPVEGMTPPVFVFVERTAPTGLVLTNAQTGWFRQGLLVTSFVTRALYYFPSFDEHSVEDPVVIFADETTPLIDVRQAPDGEIYLAAAYGLYRLITPRPGDADGDGEITLADYNALQEELNDTGSGTRTIHAHEGTFRASWGADVDQNGEIDSADLTELARLLSTRRRPVSHRSPAVRNHPVSRPIPD